MTAFAISDTVEGRDIKAIRQTLRMTQAEFSELVHVSKKPLSGGKQEKRRLPVLS